MLSQEISYTVPHAVNINLMSMQTKQSMTNWNSYSVVILSKYKGKPFIINTHKTNDQLYSKI